ncbi:MAG: DUF2920 family protein [Rhodospirillales bacterium]|nr:DUF2920 family protein [Rhodospirillales bacterium]
MDNFKTAENPHPDVENYVPRQPISYYVDYPDQGVNEETGIVFSVAGMGHYPEMDYEKLLRRYLATKYNCIAVGVVYFGQRLKRVENIQLLNNFFTNLEKYHGISMEGGVDGAAGDLTGAVCQALYEAGIRKLHHSCMGYAKYEEEYLSFGLLPALDHLQVLHQLMVDTPINKNRIFAYGASYGGYVAMLLGKYAPNTFSAIIDNSGFVSREGFPDSLYGHNAPTYISLNTVKGVELAIYEHGVWSKDPTSPHYFDIHHEKIRDLLEQTHLNPSKTHYYSYHYEKDTLVPVSGKTKFRDLWGEGNVDLTVVDDSQIDGKVFKKANHCLDATHRDIFDMSYKKYMAEDAVQKQDGITDFDLGSTFIFPCGEKSYHFSFSNDKGIRVTLDQNS